MKKQNLSQSEFTEDDLTEMVLRLAHEIRNPLATIKSAVQLIEHLQPPTGEIAEYFSSVHAEIVRIDQVVRDMQRFVKLETKAPTVVDIQEAILESTHPTTLTLADFLKPFPQLWELQRNQFGF